MAEETRIKYPPHENCGGEIIDMKPEYIPMGTDSILRIVDQTCTKCGAIIIGKYQRTKLIKDQAAHDKLMEAYAQALNPKIQEKEN